MPLVRCLDLTPTGPAINVILFKEFLQVRPDFFTVVNGPTHQYFSHDPRRVMNCDQSQDRAALFPESMGSILKVSTEGELENLTQKFLQLPLFFTVDLKRLHKSGNTRYIDRGEAVVIVNSQHPYFQDHYKGLLTEAMELMREGKRFAVELDFNGVLEDWLRDFYAQMGREGSFNTVYRCKLGRVVITNHGQYSQMFSCNNCPEVVYWWTFCFPCCLLACPIYVLQRKLRVTDLGGRIRGVQATTFTSCLSRREMEGAFTAAATLLLQQHLNQQGTVTQPPPPSHPPSYATSQQVQRGQQGPYELPTPIVYGNPAPPDV
ncbi:uncharacterized protein LOC110987848 [Acanthaster planci]|uniref:Uncharacterized protein LOC110987848 n=1 Tax=Acanthaster planci TaxID=133434 RepID=A0A8B7ZT54_ACAPL|nr:uncharacterized protein LOC110987848 [Acanthaster planci]XP_022106652.1 uncharacterized protein LOC110987848 [Acanthaster planci]